MPVILTSFKKSLYYKGSKYSVARWQPQGFDYLSLDFLAAKDRKGNALHLSSFPSSPLTGYRGEWFAAIKTRWSEIEDWFYRLQSHKYIVLCCWCPYSKATQEQIKRFGTFACHTGLIGQLIAKHKPEIGIILDDDRKNFLVKEWRP